jgi:hypothetical protein
MSLCFDFFLASLESTSESALDKFKREARERELERRAEATRREQVERERV